MSSVKRVRKANKGHVCQTQGARHFVMCGQRYLEIVSFDRDGLFGGKPFRYRQCEPCAREFGFWPEEEA